MEDLEKTIGDIWFVRENFEEIAKNPVITDRVQSVKDIMKATARYDPNKTPFSDRVIWDNYLGAVQRYLTGYDLLSIHLSSKSMEIAFLLKIDTPTKNEEKKGCRNFWRIYKILVNREILQHKNVKNSVERVITRRNMFVHDAILKQAIEDGIDEWVPNKLQELKYSEGMISVFKTAVKTLFDLQGWSELPNLRWYINPSTHKSSKKLIMNYLDHFLNELLTSVKKNKKGVLGALTSLPILLKKLREMKSKEGLNYVKYAARQNLYDVRLILDTL